MASIIAWFVTLLVMATFIDLFAGAYCRVLRTQPQVSRIARIWAPFRGVGAMLLSFVPLAFGFILFPSVAKYIDAKLPTLVVDGFVEKGGYEIMALIPFVALVLPLAISFVMAFAAVKLIKGKL